MTDAHTLCAVDTLVRVAQDKAVRQVEFIVVIVAWFAIMEAVISKTVFDTILLQVTLTGSRTGALQAASSFTLRLFLKIAHLDDLKVALTLFVGQHRHLYFGFDRLIGH